MSLTIKYEDIYYSATDYCCFTLVVTILLSLLFLKPDLSAYGEEFVSCCSVY